MRFETQQSQQTDTGFVVVTCPNRWCQKSMLVRRLKDEAVCVHCGNRWNWRRKRMVRAGR